MFITKFRTLTYYLTTRFFHFLTLSKKWRVLLRGLIGTCRPRHASKTERAKAMGKCDGHNTPMLRDRSRTHGDEKLQVLSNLGSCPVQIVDNG